MTPWKACWGRQAGQGRAAALLPLGAARRDSQTGRQGCAPCSAAGMAARACPRPSESSQGQVETPLFRPDCWELGCTA